MTVTMGGGIGVIVKVCAWPQLVPSDADIVKDVGAVPVSTSSSTLANSAAETMIA